MDGSTKKAKGTQMNQTIYWHMGLQPQPHFYYVSVLLIFHINFLKLTHYCFAFYPCKNNLHTVYNIKSLFPIPKAVDDSCWSIMISLCKSFFNYMIIKWMVGFTRVEKEFTCMGI